MVGDISGCLFYLSDVGAEIGFFQVGSHWGEGGDGEAVLDELGKKCGGVFAAGGVFEGGAVAVDLDRSDGRDRRENARQFGRGMGEGELVAPARGVLGGSDLRDRAELVERAGGHDGDVGAVFVHVGQDVRGDEDGFALLTEVDEKLAKLDAAGGIKPGGGFIEKNQRRIGQERAGDADALFHAAGKGFDPGVGFVGEPDFFEPEIGALADFGGWEVVAQPNEFEELPRGQFVINGRDIGCEADLFANVRAERLAEDGNRAAGQRLQAADRTEEGGFAGAVGTDQTQKRAGFESKRDVANSQKIGKAHAEVGQGERRRRRRRHASDDSESETGRRRIYKVMTMSWARVWRSTLVIRSSPLCFR